MRSDVGGARCEHEYLLDGDRWAGEVYAWWSVGSVGCVEETDHKHWIEGSRWGGAGHGFCRSQLLVTSVKGHHKQGLGGVGEDTGWAGVSCWERWLRNTTSSR